MKSTWMIVSDQLPFHFSNGSTRTINILVNWKFKQWKAVQILTLPWVWCSLISKSLHLYKFLFPLLQNQGTDRISVILFENKRDSGTREIPEPLTLFWQYSSANLSSCSVLFLLDVTFQKSPVFQCQSPLCLAGWAHRQPWAGLGLWPYKSWPTKGSKHFSHSFFI